MSDYGQYLAARDKSWEALLDLPEKKLPVDAEALAKKMGVEIHPFPGKEQTLLHHLVNRAAAGPCVSLRIRRSWHIFIRPKALDESHRRYAIAHELGHMYLNHTMETLAPGVRCFAARENTGDVMEDTQEMDTYCADLFAIRLLAPACLLHETHVDSSGGIMRLCGLPPHAAVVRAMRMEVLNERDAFYRDILETRVRNAFLPWLNSMLFPTPEAASVQLRYASESVPATEIHGYPGEAPMERPESPDPPPAEDAPQPFVPAKQLPAPSTFSQSKKKTMVKYILYQNRYKIFGALAALIMLAILYFIGMRD